MLKSPKVLRLLFFVIVVAINSAIIIISIIMKPLLTTTVTALVFNLTVHLFSTLASFLFSFVLFCAELMM